MTTTTHVACVILKQTADGTCTIPGSAWVALARELRDTFDADLLVHDRSYAESVREVRPHYLVDVLLQGAFDPQALLPIVRFLEPRIKRIVDTYTTPRIPRAR
jgi:hypothetical protein